jgi:hypothetical protein
MTTSSEAKREICLRMVSSLLRKNNIFGNESVPNKQPGSVGWHLRGQLKQGMEDNV